MRQKNIIFDPVINKTMHEGNYERRLQSRICLSCFFQADFASCGTALVLITTKLYTWLLCCSIPSTADTYIDCHELYCKYFLNVSISRAHPCQL